MTAAADLAAADFQEIGYLLVVEGWRVAWTNRSELAGSGPGSWIATGTDETGDTDGDAATDRVVALGLEIPESIKLEIGVVESGLPVNDGATFTLVDRDDHLIAFAEDEAGTPVYTRLDPTQDPAPSTLIGGGGDSVPLHGKHINGEAIGDAGERRRFQVLPTGALPGYDHAAIDSGVQDLRASTVRDAARWLEGRPVALYLIRRDVDGSWPSWSAQHASGCSLLWWGTLKGASAESRAWKVDCEGPSSWLRRTLNANRPADWQPLRPVLAFGPGEDRIASSFCYCTYNAQRLLGETSAYTGSDAITGGQTPAELADEINTRLQVVAGTSTADMPGGGWLAYYGATVSLTDEALSIRIADNNGGNAYGGVLALRMHAKAWLHLGWDLTLQKRSAAELSTPVEVEADIEPGFAPVWLDEVADPAPGYWTGIFTTCPAGVFWNDSPTKVDGDGALRVYNPIYSGGTDVLYPEAGQEWVVGFGVDRPYLEGQLARPPADKVLDAGACDATGFYAVRGSYKDSLEGEASTRYQIAKVSWPQATTSTAVALDGDSQAVAWAEQWLDPQAFGATNKKIDGPWALKDAEFVPLALLGYNLSGPDLAHAVLLRLLLSTGTATWTGKEGDPDASIAIGDNGHPDALLAVGEDLRGNDLEIADLGLAIPASMVDWSSFVAAAEALPGGKGGPLARTRLAYVGPFDSQQAIADIIGPRGWCFSLRGGRYGIFARSTPLDAADAEVTISPADIAGDPDELPPYESVDFRPLEPLDLVTVTYGGRNQLGDGGDEKTATIKARDPRAQQRRGNATLDVDGRSLLADGSWLHDFRELWGEQLSRFYGEPHALVRVKVKGNKARDLWPGTIVRYTSPWPATREGAYGMTARVGRVVSVSRNLQTLAAEVEILVAAGDTTTTGRRFAPIARLVDGHATVEARHDAGARKVYCYADAFGRGGSASDVAAFAEPAWLGVGGAMLARVWQSWDGVTWEQTASFEVESVDTAEHSITYAADSLTGTLWETRYAVLLPAKYEEQAGASWPTALFGVVAGSDGKFGVGDLPAYPWSP